MRIKQKTANLQIFLIWWFFFSFRQILHRLIHVEFHTFLRILRRLHKFLKKLEDITI